jgi:hypothetical protein
MSDIEEVKHFKERAEELYTENQKLKNLLNETITLANTMSEELTPEDKEDYESPYCEVCESCGEEGCCSIEKSILGHGCKYAQWYARDVYFNEMLINELLTFIQDNVDNADNIVSKIYNTAFDKAKEKYGK